MLVTKVGENVYVIMYASSGRFGYYLPTEELVITFQRKVWLLPSNGRFGYYLPTEGLVTAFQRKVWLLPSNGRFGYYLRGGCRDINAQYISPSIYIPSRGSSMQISKKVQS